jgi:hypothetical protein
MTPGVLVHRYHTVSSANTATTSNQNFLNWSTVIIHTCHSFIWHTVRRHVGLPSFAVSDCTTQVYKLFFPSFFFISCSDLLYLIIVGVEGYFCTWSQSMTHTWTHTHTHTHTHTTLGRTPPDEGWARRRDLNPTTLNTHNRQTFMSPAGFELTIPAGGRPQTHTFNRDHTNLSLWILVLDCHLPLICWGFQKVSKIRYYGFQILNS